MPLPRPRSPVRSALPSRRRAGAPADGMMRIVGRAVLRDAPDFVDGRDRQLEPRAPTADRRPRRSSDGGAARSSCLASSSASRSGDIRPIAVNAFAASPTHRPPARADRPEEPTATRASNTVRQASPIMAASATCMRQTLDAGADAYRRRRPSAIIRSATPQPPPCGSFAIEGACGPGCPPRRGARGVTARQNAARLSHPSRRARDLRAADGLADAAAAPAREYARPCRLQVERCTIGAVRSRALGVDRFRRACYHHRARDDATAPAKAPLLVAACALVDADGRVLLAQRPEGKPMAGLWEFPGGKVEPGETPGGDADPRARGGTGHRRQGGLPRAAHLREPHLSGFPSADAALCLPALGRNGDRAGRPELAWVRPNRLREYPMPPADVPLVAHLTTLL